VPGRLLAVAYVEPLRRDQLPLGATRRASEGPLFCIKLVVTVYHEPASIGHLARATDHRHRRLLLSGRRDRPHGHNCCPDGCEAAECCEVPILLQKSPRTDALPRRRRTLGSEDRV